MDVRVNKLGILRRREVIIFPVMFPAPPAHTRSSIPQCSRSSIEDADLVHETVRWHLQISFFLRVSVTCPQQNFDLEKIEKAIARKDISLKFTSLEEKKVCILFWNRRIQVT